MQALNASGSLVCTVAPIPLVRGSLAQNNLQPIAAGVIGRTPRTLYSDTGTASQPPLHFKGPCSMRKSFLVLLLLSLSACATLQGSDPLRVNLAGVEALPGEGLEMRLAVKLRVQNPNDTAINFDGVALALDLRGQEFASGLSATRGSIPRFGETVLVVPVTVGAMAILRQAYAIATGSNNNSDNGKITYFARGKLGGSGFGSTRFEARGDFDLPPGLPVAGKP